MSKPIARRLFAPLVTLQEGELATALLMFAYSFLAFTSYNIIKPLTRGEYISVIGADNIPWVILGATPFIAVLMQGYGRLTDLLPRRWVIPIFQSLILACIVAFWRLIALPEAWIRVAFYVFSLIMGILLVSQFWTLANVVYDPRQAKRIFGFIGAGSSLGGVAGSLLSSRAETFGTVNLLLFSAGFMAACLLVVVVVVQREKPERLRDLTLKGEEGVGGKEAFQMLRESKHLQTIAVIIAFAAIGASLVDQQLNMATQEAKGQGATDAISAFLALVQASMSTIAFVIQIALTSRIHRFLGIGFALLILPMNLGATALLMLAFGTTWSSALARTADQSLRYTVDKTSREVLFLPLPAALKYKAKPFVDVTVDRFGKGLGAVFALVLIKPWGFGLAWPQISLASLVITLVWIGMAIRARLAYVAAFRRSLERHDVEPEQVRHDLADLSTIETLIAELANPDPHRVIYAIELLETLDKRNLITPLLLYHEAPAVRARALAALGAARPEVARRWLPSVQRMLADPDREVRAAAVGALVAIRDEQATDLVRPFLEDADPRIATTAAVVLARSERIADIEAAERVLARLTADTRDSAAEARRHAAAALGQIPDARFHFLLIPLLADPDPEVADEAIEGVRQLGSAQFVFVPALVSLLRNRRLKSRAVETLVGYGEEALDALNHFLRDPGEDIRVRRQLPSVIARIRSQKAMGLLVSALAETDGSLRFRVITAIEELRRARGDLAIDPEPIHVLAVRESARYCRYLCVHHNLFAVGTLPRDSILARVLEQKLARMVDRTYRLLGLVYPWRDVFAARRAIERGDARTRAAGAEYLDNLLSGALRSRLQVIFDDLPLDERVRRARVLAKTRQRNTEESLLELVHDEDEVVSAAAIAMVEREKLWSLADDLEFVLAHRDVRDWAVFEAASWALAASRMPAERRRSLWLEPLPAVELAERLRRLEILSSVPIDDLFEMARSGRQVRWEVGQELCREGARPDAAHFLLDGALVADSQAGSPRPISAPAEVAFDEVLEGCAVAETVRSFEPSICLALTSDEIAALLADNAALVDGLVRHWAARAHGPDGIILDGQDPGAVERLPAATLAPAQEAMALGQVPAFDGVDADELLALSDAARQVSLAAGARPFEDVDTSACYVVLSGRMLVAQPAGAPPLEAGPGDAVGVYQMLRGVALSMPVHVSDACRALRIDRDAFIDVLGRRPALLKQLFGVLYRRRTSAHAGADA